MPESRRSPVPASVQHCSSCWRRCFRSRKPYLQVSTVEIRLVCLAQAGRRGFNLLCFLFANIATWLITLPQSGMKTRKKTCQVTHVTQHFYLSVSALTDFRSTRAGLAWLSLRWSPPSGSSGSRSSGPRLLRPRFGGAAQHAGQHAGPEGPSPENKAARDGAFGAWRKLCSKGFSQSFRASLASLPDLILGSIGFSAMPLNGKRAKPSLPLPAISCFFGV